MKIYKRENFFRNEETSTVEKYCAVCGFPGVTYDLCNECDKKYPLENRPEWVKTLIQAEQQRRYIDCKEEADSFTDLGLDMQGEKDFD